MNIKSVLIGLLLCSTVSMVSAQELRTAADSVSYSAGVILAENLIKQGFTEISPEIFAEAIDDALSGNDMTLERAKADEIFQKALLDQKVKMKEANKLAGQAFLAENTKKTGVTTLPSGLQYEVMKEGDGVYPAATSTVITHYEGTLIDGTVFDSSVERGQPLTFGLNRVIQAWQEALPLMKVGSKWRIFAPYNLAYGERGAGATIQPYSALIFEIELLGIEK